MSIIDVAYALTTPVEAVMSFMMFDRFFERRKQFQIWQYGVGIVALAIMIKLSNTYFLFRAGNVIGMLLATIIVSEIFYKTSAAKRIFLPVFLWALWSSVETIIFNFITSIFDITATEAVNTPTYLVLGIFISKLIEFVIVYIVCAKDLFKEFEFEKTYWIVFFVLLFSAICTSYLIFGMMNRINDPRFNVIAMFCTIGLYVGTFLSFYLYARSQRQHQIIRHQEQSEQQMRGQLKHMDEIILKQNELRAMRHDMNAHLTALKGLLDSGALAESRDYVSALVDQFQQVAPAVNTGNNALDAILSAKQSLAESKGIAFRTHLRIQERLPIAPEDLAIIFGNALDNAIEACDRLPEGAEKRITLVLQQDATMLLCRITNTAPEKKNALLATSKADKANHGFGVQNIREALDKYEATVTFSQEGTLFHFSFMLFY